MVAVIAYQSLNSNSSTTHDLAASTSQTFLVNAQRTLASLYADPKSGALKYPTNPHIAPHEALQGPAQLVAVAEGTYMDVEKPNKKRKRSAMESDEEANQAYAEAKDRTLSMVQGKARQIYQQAYRDVHEACDLIVFGELDSTHADWKSVPGAAGKRIKASIQSKACNCFSLHSSGGEAKVQFVGEGEGWCAAKCNGVLTVFVHVPNALATKKDKAIAFYKKIKTAVLQAPNGGVIDLVMGDTNQSSESFSPDVISKGLDLKFLDAHTSGHILPTDTWAETPVTHSGTNSANSKKFDVAVYNAGTVKSIKVKYFTQLSFDSGKAAAYTDHMGILVRVEKK